jgi:hypothetical protein
MGCARRSDFRFNLDLQLITGKPTGIERGSIAHHYLEAFYKALTKGCKRDEANQLGLKHASLFIKGCPFCIVSQKCPFNHPEGEFLGVKNTPEESQKASKTTGDKKIIGWAEVIKTVQDYIEFTINDSWIPLEVECVKGKVIYEDDDIRILWKAKYDLIVDTEDGILSVDHKMMSFNYAMSDLNNQFMGQTLLLNSPYIVINEIGLQSTYAPKDKFKREKKYYTKNQLTEFATEIVPYWAKMLVMYAESGYFPPNYAHCEGRFGLCDFYEVCREDKMARESKLRMLFVKGRKWDISSEE